MDAAKTVFRSVQGSECLTGPMEMCICHLNSILNDLLKSRNIRASGATSFNMFEGASAPSRHTVAQ
jgi:hypothetical protein